MQNLLDDVQQGHLRMTDESAFEVGRNVATTEGAVVFENELFQLIEYKPLTAKVYERPLLLVPPCINKFYILDLQPENSLIRYAVEQGHRVFVVSWRNPDASHGQVHLGRLHRGRRDQGDRTSRRRSPAAEGQINALGFCVGGTILRTALAVLAARGEKPAASAHAADHAARLHRHRRARHLHRRGLRRSTARCRWRKGGLLPGGELASTFSFLRPNDLVWNYVVGNYLKGETPPPFDLLYWNSDATNLPGPDVLLVPAQHLPTRTSCRARRADGVRRAGRPAAASRCRSSSTARARTTSCPIGGAYASTQLLPGKKRFVLGASGHIAGVINPPAKNKRSHWIATTASCRQTQDEWLDGAKEHPGSWWTDWSNWLKTHAGKQIPAPKTYGKGSAYKAIEPAPGRYVKAKA